MYKKLYKARYGVKIDGVCAGLAKHLDMDPTVMRFIWVVGTLFSNFAGVIAYIACSVIMPREPGNYDKSEFDHQNNFNHSDQNDDNNNNYNN